MINLMPGVESAASALHAEKIRMEVIAQNIANANVTKMADGKPYERQVVRFDSILSEKLGADSQAVPQFVKAASIVGDGRPPKIMFQPGHPDANESGMVAYPNVDVHIEMADMIASSRTYEANLAVIKNARSMALQTLSIGHR
ncbi:MAG: flagellar basal body rod protein FlgC [Verrucomicrobia bacterium]|nr:flagellar basal body rod protein FlgC [Verrucomicrobiota bacterium]